MHTDLLSDHKGIKWYLLTGTDAHPVSFAMRISTSGFELSLKSKSQQIRLLIMWALRCPGVKNNKAYFETHQKIRWLEWWINEYLVKQQKN